MAQKYSHKTLNGNWFEEQHEPGKSPSSPIIGNDTSRTWSTEHRSMTTGVWGEFKGRESTRDIPTEKRFESMSTAVFRAPEQQSAPFRPPTVPEPDALSNYHSRWTKAGPASVARMNLTEHKISHAAPMKTQFRLKEIFERYRNVLSFNTSEPNLVLLQAFQQQDTAGTKSVSKFNFEKVAQSVGLPYIKGDAETALAFYPAKEDSLLIAYEEFVQAL